MAHWLDWMNALSTLFIAIFSFLQFKIYKRTVEETQNQEMKYNKILQAQVCAILAGQTTARTGGNPIGVYREYMEKKDDLGI